MSQPFIVCEAAQPTKTSGFAARLAASLAAFMASTALGLISLPAAALDGPQKLPVVQLGIGLYNIKAEVARTQQEHAIGLMYRQSMPINHGMLFVFEQPQRQCFWMKNTLIPLSIAFLRDDGTVVNVAEMKAGSLDSHCSAEPVRLALEMNQGWFSRRGIKPGDRLAGAPFGTPR